MGLRYIFLLALGTIQLGITQAGIGRHVQRQQTDVKGKYCPGGTNICFSEYVTTSNVIYRIAIPDVSAAPFDILLQIIAPVSVTWAAVAWGGAMANNPLTVAWPSGSSAVVSSRWSTGHTLPQAYAGASYSLLPTSTTNTTHWQADVLCRGCSTWGTTSLNPNGANVLAWAKSNRAVVTPASNTSNFAYHDAKGTFSHDFSAAKIPKGVFDALAYELSGPSSGTAIAPGSTASAPTPVTSSAVVTAVSSQSTPGIKTLPPTTNPVQSVTTPIIQSPSTVSPVVVTSVATLPRPSTTLTIPKPPATTPSLSLSPDQPISASTPVSGITTSYVTIYVTQTAPPGTEVTASAVPTVIPKPATTLIPPFRFPPFKGKGKGPPFRRPPLDDPIDA